MIDITDWLTREATTLTGVHSTLAERAVVLTIWAAASSTRSSNASAASVPPGNALDKAHAAVLLARAAAMTDEASILVARSAAMLAEVVALVIATEHATAPTHIEHAMAQAPGQTVSIEERPGSVEELVSALRDFKR